MLDSGSECRCRDLSKEANLQSMPYSVSVSKIGQPDTQIMLRVVGREGLKTAEIRECTVE